MKKYRIKPVDEHKSLMTSEWEFAFYVVERYVGWGIWWTEYTAFTEEEAKEYIKRKTE